MGIHLKIRFTQTAISWVLFFLGFWQSVKRQLRHVESLIKQGTALHDFKWLLWFCCTQANFFFFCHLVGGTTVDFHVKWRQMHSLFELILLDSKLSIFNSICEHKIKANALGILGGSCSGQEVAYSFFQYSSTHCVQVNASNRDVATSSVQL